MYCIITACSVDCIGEFNQRQGEALPPQVFLTLKCVVWTQNYRMMTFCYNDETSTETARTAAVFRHILAWILHVCLISLVFSFLQNIARKSVVTNFSSLYTDDLLIYSFERTLEIGNFGIRVCQTFAQGSHRERHIPWPLAVPSGNESLFFSMVVL